MKMFNLYNTKFIVLIDLICVILCYSKYFKFDILIIFKSVISKIITEELHIPSY